MTRPRIASLLIVAVAASATIANAYFATAPKPCFVTGTHAYRISGDGNASVTVRVDKTASHPTLRMQLVNDPATADFVMVDDNGNAAACSGIGAVKSIRLDAEAAKPDLTVALSRAEAPYKIYVHSVRYTPQDAAALFAVMRQDASASTLAARD